ncbi:MAG: hypothetical protein OQJ89_06940, partial [Kangiellaceae bacterium]|nr:hypothetical protein [Kangiellaceae bacterium]
MSLFGSFQPLSESERFAYLKAMGVTLWIPREEAESLAESDAKIASQTKPQAIIERESIPAEQKGAAKDVSDLTSQVLSATIQSDAENKSVAKEDIAVRRDLSSQNSHERQDKIPASTQVDSKTKPLKPNKAASAGFLKVVNWSSGNEHAPLLLIICRHDPDQPAQSFARPNMPSQFMVDYVRAIQEYLSAAKLDFRIQLAHLTEAGLGENNLPIESVVEKQSPKLILVLGDEGVAHLLGSEQNVSVNRGKQLTILEQVQALVSYHPFTLI